MTINELIKTAHEDAKAKGWWDEPRNTGELLMLIVSECGEALEAHRSGKRANLAAWADTCLMLGSPPDRVMSEDEASKAAFGAHIKDTFEDELADIVIRIADLCGDIEYSPERGPMVHMCENVGEDLLHVVKMVSADSPVYLGAAMLYVFAMAEHHNIDLWRHIELKLAYNRTRPYKHAKAY